MLPYPVWQGPPGGHTPAEVTEDPEDNHTWLQAAGSSLWGKKYTVSSGSHVREARGTRADARAVGLAQEGLRGSAQAGWPQARQLGAESLPKGAQAN